MASRELYPRVGFIVTNPVADGPAARAARPGMRDRRHQIRPKRRQRRCALIPRQGVSRAELIITPKECNHASRGASVTASDDMPSQSNGRGG